MNPVHTLLPLPSLPSGLFLQAYQPKPYTHFSFPMHATYLIHLILHDQVTLVRFSK